jgi:parallel beta-helix repeat protein
MRENDVRPVHGTSWRQLGWTLACLPILLLSVGAADDLCGATIVANLKLDHDLTCPAGGLTAGADAITINLNGHTITGAGSGVGIDLAGRTGVRISNGTITNFTVGIRITASSDVVVKGVEFNENNDGVDCMAGCIGNTIKENQFRNHGARGIMLRSGSMNNNVRENSFSGNNVGILLFGAVATTVKENYVASSRLAGIRIGVLATGNRIQENSVVSNPAGVDFAVTPTGSATGNAVIENTILMNVCGLRGPLAGNTVEQNVFGGNGNDSCS